MPYETLRFDVAYGVATITLDRPGCANTCAVAWETDACISADRHRKGPGASP